MTDFEKWKAFLTEQNVGFAVDRHWQTGTPTICLVGTHVLNFFAGCDIVFNADESLDKVEVSE